MMVLVASISWHTSPLFDFEAGKPALLAECRLACDEAFISTQFSSRSTASSQQLSLASISALRFCVSTSFKQAEMKTSALIHEQIMVFVCRYILERSKLEKDKWIKTGCHEITVLILSVPNQCTCKSKQLPYHVQME